MDEFIQDHPPISVARSAVAALKNGYKQVYLCKPTHGGPRVTVRRLFGAKK